MFTGYNKVQKLVSKSKILFVSAERKQRLDVGCSQVVLQSIVSKVMYALSAWGGYVSRENISRIFFKCCMKRDVVVSLAHYSV